VQTFLQRNPSSNGTVKLKTRLQNARVECEEGKYVSFVPESKKREIITPETVADEIRSALPQMDFGWIQERAKQVMDNSLNLFAILAYIGKAGDICSFLDEEVTDHDLPFERSNRSDKDRFHLCRSGQKEIRSLEQWDPKKLEKLGVNQWIMLAPIFAGQIPQKHRKLHMNTILPFIGFQRIGEEGEMNISLTGGGYSTIFRAQIHPSHHHFQDHLPDEVRLSVIP
jgi:hypothetical protein